MDVPVTGPAQIPATVEVICGTLRGTYDVAKTKILYLSHLGGIREATPTEFERLGGRQATKKWKQSIRVVDAQGQPGKSLGEWLAGTAGTAGDGQRQAFAWLTMGQRGTAWADGGDAGRGTSQSKASQLREQFQLQLLDFLHGRIDNPGAGPGVQAPGGEFGPVTVGSHTFDLRKMYTRVREMGGYAAVQAMADGWGKIAGSIGLETSTPNTPHACRAVYEHYLLRAERLEKAREAAGIPPPQPAPRRQPSSPTGSGPSHPGVGAGGGPQLKQEPPANDRMQPPDRTLSVAQRAPPPAGPAAYTGRRPQQQQQPPPPQQQWGPPTGGRSGGRGLDEPRLAPGGGHGKASYGSARNDGPGYDMSQHDDMVGAYEGRGAYNGPGRSGYESQGRGGYGGGRGAYDEPGRGGYDGGGGGGGGRGGYDSGRRGFDAGGGGRGGYDPDDRPDLGVGGGMRGGYDGGGRGSLELSGRGPYDTVTGGGSRGYRGDGGHLVDSAAERRQLALEALIQGAHLQPQGRYDNPYESRSSLLPLDINEDQLILAAGLGLGRDARDAAAVAAAAAAAGGGGPLATPLVLDNSALLPLGGRQQQPSLHLGGGGGSGRGGPQQRSLLHLQLGGGGGRQQQDPREALLVTVAGGTSGRSGLSQTMDGNLVSLAGGPAAASGGRLLPIALGRGGGGGSGVGQAQLLDQLPTGLLARSRAGGALGALQQLQGSRAAALLGLQGDLRDGTGMDDPTISNLLSEYFSGSGGLSGLGLVRTSSGNIGVSGLNLGGGGGGAGFKRGPPDGGGGSGESGAGPHKRTAL